MGDGHWGLAWQGLSPSSSIALCFLPSCTMPELLLLPDALPYSQATLDGIGAKCEI